jgi:hypothetical protein
MRRAARSRRNHEIETNRYLRGGAGLRGLHVLSAVPRTRASWTVHYRDLRFPGSGSVPAVKVLPGDTVDEPGNITNAADGNLIFSGWYTETACETRWTSVTPWRRASRSTPNGTRGHSGLYGHFGWSRLGSSRGDRGPGRGPVHPGVLQGHTVIRTADRSFYQKSTLQSVILPEE